MYLPRKFLRLYIYIARFTCFNIIINAGCRHPEKDGEKFNGRSQEIQDIRREKGMEKEYLKITYWLYRNSLIFFQKKKKKVLDIRPNIDWDKGRALQYLLDTLGYDSTSEDVFPVYIGDDKTDEDAFTVMINTLFILDLENSTLLGLCRIDLNLFYFIFLVQYDSDLNLLCFEIHNSLCKIFTKVT